MDEKPNNIDNEKPLNNNGFSSVSNHQDKIDNLDDSSKNNLQNDQNNQLNKQNILRNTNPMANKQDENINSNINNQNNLQQSMRSNENVPDALKRDNELPPKLSNGVSELDENHDINKPVGIKGRLLNGIKPGLLKGGKVGKALAAVKTIRSVRRITLLPFLPILFILIIPIVIIAVIIASAVSPMFIKTKDVFGSDNKVIQNYFEYKGISTDKEEIENYYKKIDTITDNYSEIDKSLLVGSMHYGFYKIDNFFDKLSGEKENVEFDYDELTKNALTFSNQLVYSTVIFDNNIIARETDEEETIIVEEIQEDGSIKKVKKKVKKVVYECPSSSYTIYTSKKELCKDGIAVYKDGPGDLDFSTADYCENYVNDSKIKDFIGKKGFDKDMKCVSINYETNTEKSKEKFKNFLKYVLIPDKYIGNKLTNNETINKAIEYLKGLLNDGYSWKKFVSKFSTIVTDNDKNDYNIPSHEVGEGKNIDYYSNLEYDDKKTVDEAIDLIMSLVDTSKTASKLDNKYHIEGNASLPLDFVIKDTPEETINSRLSSSLSLYGWRIHPVYGDRRFHHGIDLSKITDADPVYAVLDGVVTDASSIPIGCGTSVTIGHDVNYDGKYDYYSRYCHLASKLVNTGDTVYNGQQIGIMGTTGTSTGIHLHFEWRESEYNDVDPVPVLVSIASDSSTFNNKNNTLTNDNIQELETTFNTLISGNLKTRKGVAIAAKFLIDNLSTLPYFCGGRTTNLIDKNWYTDKVVQDSTCSEYNSNSKYGLDQSGFVSWVLIQSGYANKYYTYNELLNLGDKVNMYDEKVQIGDIAYNNNKLGIIVDINDESALVVSMETDGLKATTINRKSIISSFPKVISMNNFYKG